MQHQTKASILVVDENQTAAERLKGILGENGYDVTLAEPSGALERVEQAYFDLAFLSWQITTPSAEDFLYRLRDLFPDLMVLVTHPMPSLAEAVKAMRLGAFNFLPAEPDPAHLLPLVQEAVNFRHLRREQGERRLRLRRKYDVDRIIGQSTPMQEVFRLIHKVAGTDATVMVLGESGTGKELVARAIHAQSPRREGPLVPVNCGAIPEELLESELFGHERGAFTGAIKTRLGRFELAEGGTVFLDEIGDMSPLLQVKLLRVLQEHQFERIGGTKTISADIRVIAATHQDLAKCVQDGRFREDLYYRLNVIPIYVPPLRERRSDIKLLCQHFLNRHSQQKGLGGKRLHPEVEDRLMRYNWPGNVRELENLLERMVILAEGDVLLPEDLPLRFDGPPPKPLAAAPSEGALHTVEVPEGGLDLKATMEEIESKFILDALERTGWVKNQAAALLGLNRTTLVEKIKKKKLTPSALTGNS